MKKSFFKRALASVAVIPLALTQCLSYSFAATDESSVASAADSTDLSAAVNTNITLDSLLYISPDAEIVNGVQTSEWNMNVYSVIMNAAQNGNGSVAIDPTSAMYLITANAGAYKQLVSAIFDEVKDTTCEVKSDNKIVIKGSFDNLNNTITEFAQERVDQEITAIAEKYPEADFGELKNINFDKLGEIAGTVTATVDASGLEDSTTTPVTYEIALTDGSTLTMTSALEYVLDKYEAAKGIVNDTVNSVFADVREDLDDAKAQLDAADVQAADAEIKLEDASDKLAEAQSKIDNAQAELDNALAELDEAEETGVNVDEARQNVADRQDELNSKQAELDSKQAEYEDAVNEFNTKLAELEDAKARYAQAEIDFDEAGATVGVKIDEAFAVYDKQITKALNFIDTYTADDFSASRSFTDTADALAGLKAWATKKNMPNVAKRIPGTVTAGITKPGVTDAFENFKNQLNASIIAPAVLNMTTAEIGEFADNEIKDLEISLEAGILTIKALNVTDKEQDKLAEALDKKGLELVSSHKEITFSTSLDAMNTGSGEFTLDIIRVLETKDKVTETTAATTIGSETETNTTAVTSGSETGTNTTASTSGSETGTNTTASTSGSETGTNTTASTSGSETGTNTTASTSGSETDTNTTAATTAGSGIDTTTSATTAGSGTDTTTSATTAGSDTDTTTSATTAGSDTDTTTSATGSDTDTDTTTSTSGTDTNTDTNTSTSTSGSADTSTSTSESTSTTTTTTTSFVRAYVVAEVGTQVCAELKGYFFSHDNREFSADMLETLDMYESFYLVEEYTDGENIFTREVSFADALAADEFSFNGVKPAGVFDAESGFVYEIPMYYKGEKLNDENGVYISLRAYIGVKGDVDLNGMVQASDASVLLNYYAKVQTYNGTGNAKEEITLCPGVVYASEDYQNLSAFLGDVNFDEKDPNNWSMTKSDRQLTVIDASDILKFFAEKNTTIDPVVYDIWDKKIVPGLLIEQ